MKIFARTTCALAALCVLGGGAALADIRIGITVSATGSGAALGVPQKNSVAQMPTEMGGEKVQYIVLDDASDATKSVSNARKMISEDKIDVLIGSSLTPTSLPLVDVAAETKTPYIATVPTLRLVEPVDDKRRWVFKVVQNDFIMADVISEYMVKHGVKTVGFIGYNDAYGDGWWEQAEKAFGAKGIKLIARESFARADTSVTGQTLKLMAANPDAILVAASGTPAVLPQKTLRERGFKGPIYQTHGIATMEFVRVGGKDVDGTIFPAGPMVVAGQLPDSNPVKAGALSYEKSYEDMYKTSFAAFGGHMVDAAKIVAAAAPAALKVAKPGTPEFRAALRDSIESTKEIIITHGVINYSPTDHAGLDKRARVLIEIKDGAWKYLPEY